MTQLIVNIPFIWNNSAYFQLTHMDGDDVGGGVEGPDAGIE